MLMMEMLVMLLGDAGHCSGGCCCGHCGDHIDIILGEGGDRGCSRAMVVMLEMFVFVMLGIVVTLW